MAPPLKHYSAESRRQLGQMDLLASPSRSGGHAANEDALLSFETQDRFRAHIEEKLVALRARFGEMLDDGWDKVITMGGEREAYYAIVDMLLLLRKLREGIVASKRRDPFAIEVYETAARLALKTANHTHLVSSLSALVRDLYPSLDTPDQSTDRLAVDLKRLSIESKRPPPTAKPAYIPPHLRKAAAGTPPASCPPPPFRPASAHAAGNRDLFVSIYLILQLSHHQSPSSFVSLLSEVTGSTSALYRPSAPSHLRRRSNPRPGKEVARPIISPSSPALVLSRRIYRAYVASNHVLLHRLLSPTPPLLVHPLERLALLYGLPAHRALGWRLTRAAYRDLGLSDVPWLEADVLGCQAIGEGDGAGVRWLEQEKGCAKGPTGRWLLKSGSG